MMNCSMLTIWKFIPVAREYFGKRGVLIAPDSRVATRRNRAWLIPPRRALLSGASGVHRGEIFTCDGYILPGVIYPQRNVLK